MEVSRLQIWHACWNNRKKFSRLDRDHGYMGNIYLLYIRILILLTRRKWSITPNERMIQPSNISCGGTHKSWSHKIIAKDQYRTVYMLEIKWPSKIKNWCVWEVICEYNLYGVVSPQLIFWIWNSLEKIKDNRCWYYMW